MIALDQTVKLLVDTVLPPEGARVARLFDFQRVYNPGINFGAFRDYPTAVLIGTIVVGVAFLAYVWRRPPRSVLAIVGLGILLGGGLGNLIDRVRLGAVFDYLNITPFIGYLNLADLAIGAGVIALVVETIWRDRRA